MKVDEVKEYFVTWRNAMRKLDISPNCYMHWRRKGYIPYHQQVKIETLSNGLLKADEKDKRSRGQNGDEETAKRASRANQRRAGTL